MGKNNNKNNSSNFFTNIIKEKGEDFISQLSVRDMQYNAVKIFKDLARCNIDISKYGKYFCEYQFNRSLFVVAQEKFTYFSISCQGVYLLIQNIVNSGNQVSQEVQIVYEKHKKSMEVYSIIMEGLNNVLYTGNPECLFPMINILSKYRNNI